MCTHFNGNKSRSNFLESYAGIINLKEELAEWNIEESNNKGIVRFYDSYIMFSNDITSFSKTLRQPLIFKTPKLFFKILSLLNSWFQLFDIRRYNITSEILSQFFVKCMWVQ